MVDNRQAVRYEAIIGMEVHAQLFSASKIFCGCSADYAAAPPNTHVCPTCMALPGVLPVINREAVIATIRTGLALNCDVQPFSKFDRKNYPYPDLPKGYQISQYDLPFCTDGWLEIDSAGETKRIRIRRVHLEEDTAKLIHAPEGSLIDYNRAGIPLMEIVTEADMRSAEDAWAYLTSLRAILRYLEVSSGNMEEGAMRCEANISLRPAGTDAFGTKVEVKNLNSFRAVRNAIAYEFDRQRAALTEGGQVRQVTMGWDEEHGRTVFQRSKEYAEDYRYFPEPDLPPLTFTEEWVDDVRASLPELPRAKAERFIAAYALRPADAKLLTEEKAVAEYFEAVVRATTGVEARTVANWMTGEVFRLLAQEGQAIDSWHVSPDELARLLLLVEDGTINATVAKQVLDEMHASGESAAEIVRSAGLTQISDADALRDTILNVIDSNPVPVQQYLDGKDAVLGFLIGQAMRITRGRANARTVGDLLREELESRKTR
jgi:aspartyl-tRNA(Asn)/glutamyl-tRNA(Gln) amidotransferase subunit B